MQKRTGRTHCAVSEPLESRLLMSMSLKVGGSGFSNLLATDSAAVRQQKLIIDPPEPLAGSTSHLYDPKLVSLVGARGGPGYDNDQFGGFVEVRSANGTFLQPLRSFLERPAGEETGYVQIRFVLEGQAGQIDPGREILDEDGTEGMDTHELQFKLLDGVPETTEFNYAAFAAKRGERGDNEEDFLITNDGTQTRLGPDQLSRSDSTSHPKDGSLTGVVFEDMDGDGRFGRVDKFLPDVTVFLDLDGDGKRGDNEPRQITNEIGGYVFDDLEPGRYLVREETPDGFLPQTTVPREGVYVVSVEPGRRVRNLDFGNVRPGGISGHVFNDLNANGVHDAGEGQVAGATVYLDDNNNGVLDAGETVAGPGGSISFWQFSGLAPGTYIVRQVPPAGYTQTFPAAGGAHVVTIASGGGVAGLWFGDHTQARPPKVLALAVRGSTWSSNFMRALEANQEGSRFAGYRIQYETDAPIFLPWVNVDQVVVIFDQDVQIDPADLRIDGVRNDYRAATVGRLTGIDHAYVFTLSRILGHSGLSGNGDRLLLEVNADPPAGVTGSAAPQVPLDGDGDGVAGGDFRAAFNILQGDANRSGVVSPLDYVGTRFRQGSTAFGAGARRYSVFYDVDGNGAINVSDAVFVRRRLGRGLPPQGPLLA